MKANMEHFQEKIEEMQRKLNLINENIEQIKKGRNKHDDNKTTNKIDDYLKNNINKKDYLKINNDINLFNKKNVINNELNSISNKTVKTFYHYKNSNSEINILNRGIHNIKKKNDCLSTKLNLNNEPKFMEYLIETNKKETPSFLRNISSYKNYNNNLSNNYLIENQSNNYLNKKKMRKTNSAADIIHSISSTKGHRKYKKFLNDKRNRNIEINNKNSSSFLSNNLSYDKENKINQNSIHTYRTKNNINLSKETPRMRLIENQVYCNLSHNLKRQKSSNTLENNNKNRYYSSSLSNNRTYMIQSKSKNKNEKLFLDIIKATNEYNFGKYGKNKLDIDNILNEYKLILYNNKINNEFITKLTRLYNKNHRINLDINNYESLETLLNWIKANIDSRKQRENDEYRNLCKNIMKEYNLENIGQLKIFIMKMLKKLNNNENFLEGIKRILLP